LIFFLSLDFPANIFSAKITIDGSLSGEESITRARSLVSEGKYVDAAEYFWQAIIKWRGDKSSSYTIREVHQEFHNTFATRGVPEESFIYIAKAYFNAKQIKEAIASLKEARKIKPTSLETNLLLGEYVGKSNQEELNEKVSYIMTALEIDPTNAKVR